jgi:tripartite ATP-independent transporter DctM subunit
VVLVGILFVALVLLGLPVVACLALTGIVGVAWTQDVPLAVVAAKTVSASDNFILLAIPLFMLAGSLMTAGGIAQRLFDLARVLVGHTTGGLAQVNVFLSVMIGGIQGSSAADAAIDCKVTIPQMRAEGYPAALSGAITAVSGMLSNVIPPSIAMLVYASMANVSVGKLFVAGIVPGVLLALAMSVTVHRVCRRMGYGARAPRASWGEVWAAFRRSAFALAIPVVIVGGIRFGYFTPTEAGGIAVLMTLVLGSLVYRAVRLHDLPGILAKTAVDSGVVMLIVSFSAPVSWVLAYNQVPQQAAAVFAAFGQSQAVFLLVVNVFLLLGGAFMEGVTLLILVTPILASVAAQLGLDPIHFGMVVVVNVVLGAITPPFGQLVFFVSSMTGIAPDAIFRQVLRFFPALVLVLAVVTYLPATYLWTVRAFGP